MLTFILILCHASAWVGNADDLIAPPVARSPVKIVDDVGPIKDVHLASMNAAGKIAFCAKTAEGRHVLFACNAGDRPAEVVGAVVLAGEPHLLGISDAGDFLVGPTAPQNPIPGTDGMYLLKDRKAIRLVPPGKYTRVGTMGSPVLDRTGRRVVFTSDDQITLYEDGQETVVATAGPGHPYLFLGDDPAFGPDGEVIFFATLNGGRDSIFCYRGGKAVELLSGDTAFDHINRVSVPRNKTGGVVFDGKTRKGADGVFVAGADGTVKEVAVSGKVFKMVGLVGVTDEGAVVLYAEPVQDGKGIFAGPDPSRHKLIKVGDVLDGSPVTEVGHWAVDAGGRVLFQVTLASGRKALFLSDRIQGQR